MVKELHKRFSFDLKVGREWIDVSKMAKCRLMGANYASVKYLQKHCF